MSQTLGQLVLKIASDTAGAEKGIAALNSKVSGAFNGLKTIITAAAVGAVAKWTDTTVKLGMEAEKVRGIYEASIKTTLGLTEEQIAASEKWINANERINAFDGEDMMATIQKLAQQWGSMEVAQTAASAAMEISRNRNISLEEAADKVSKVMMGQSKIANELGIEIDKDATATDRLKELTDKFAGSTEAYNKTAMAQKEAMSLAYEAMRETLGEALIPIANALMQKLSPAIQAISDWLAANGDKIQGFVDALLKGIEWIVETAGKMWDALKPSFEAIKDTFGPYIKELFDWLGTKGETLQTVLVGVAEAIGTAFRIVAAVIQGIVDAITWVVENIGKALAWSKEQGALGANAGGVYVPPVAALPPSGWHAAGGWVGMNGPEIIGVGEKGPEYVTPASQMGDNKAILQRLDMLISAVTRVAPGVGAAINGLGRSA
jgi:hypothetical protein